MIITTCLSKPNFLYNSYNNIFIDLLYFLRKSYKKFLRFKFVNNIFPVHSFDNKLKIKLIFYKIIASKRKHDMESTILGLFYKGENDFICNENEIILSVLLGISYRKYSSDRYINFRYKINLLCLPSIQKNSSFIINKINRTLISQLKRVTKLGFNKQNKAIVIKIIPKIGPSLEFKLTRYRTIFCLIDKKMKLSLSDFLLILGYDMNYLLNFFNLISDAYILNGQFYVEISLYKLLGTFIKFNIYNKYGNLLLFKNNYIDKPINFSYKIFYKLNLSNYTNLVLAESVKLGNIFFKKGNRLNLFKICTINRRNILRFKIFSINSIYSGKYIYNLLFNYNIFNTNIKFNDVLNTCYFEKNNYANLDNLREIFIKNNKYTNYNIHNNRNNSIDHILTNFLNIFKVIKKQLFKRLDLFNLTIGNKKYFLLSKSLRQELNLLLKRSDSSLKFHRLDILLIIKLLVEFNVNKFYFNDIDDIIGKKLLSSGAHLKVLLNSRFGNLSRYLTNNISSNLPISMNINYIINSNLTNSIKEFFSISPLSQFTDQINYLSEITHKRRISLLYDVNIKKTQISKHIREINNSYYCKLCPIETPEGKNIGVINSLSCLSIIKNGIIYTPYINILKNNRIRLLYLSYYNECKFTLCDKIYLSLYDKFYNLSTNNYNKRSIKKYSYNFFNQGVIYKRGNLFVLSSKESRCIYNLSAIQLFSIAPIMIPFMNYNDGNRVLMGSNMQRQAVPCVRLSLPYIATGIEFMPSVNLGYCSIISNRYRIYYYDSNLVLYGLIIRNIFILKTKIFKKFIMTNQYTCNNISINHIFFKNQLSNLRYFNKTNSTIDNFLCLGHNLLTAFIPWRGYNFEDSIIISETVAKSDDFASIHVNKINIIFKKSIFGNDIIKKNSKGLSNRNFSNLDNYGVIKLGVFVIEGDVLVCRCSAISNDFNRKSDDLFDYMQFGKNFKYYPTYVKVPHGINGKITNIDFVYSNRQKICPSKCFNLNTLQLYFNIILKIYYRYIVYLVKKNNNNKLKFGDIKTKISRFILLRKIDIYTEYKICIINNIILNLYNEFKYYKNKIKLYNKKKTDLNKWIKKIIITITSKKYLSIGDKMSGRYGNKGVISKILPVEDMPMLMDGTPCDLILNPISIPSRMNIGQLYELQLGLLIFFLFKRIEFLIKNNRLVTLFSYLNLIGIIIPNEKKKYFIENYINILVFMIRPFEQLKYDPIELGNKIIDNNLRKKYKIKPSNDKLRIRDGISGTLYKGFISFGYMYFLKLNHLAVDKVHARSIGPYSLVTQQPLKGKINLGGQRFGEMEVWALEAYGAAYTLCEITTLKSDNLLARKYIFNNLIFGTCSLNNNIPESLNTLINEINCLGVYINLL